MKLAMVVCVLAACERAPAKTILTSRTPAASRMSAPYYAALFAKGASWRYTVTRTDERYDPDDPKADHDGMLRETSTAEARCTVIEARAWRAGMTSRLECEGLGDDDPITGAWVADARGLYKVGELTASGEPDLTDAELVIAAAPHEGKQEQDGPDEGFGESTEISAQPGGWCVTHAAWGGDESYTTLCFAKAGVTSGAAGWSGGSSHDTTFDLR